MGPIIYRRSSEVDHIPGNLFSVFQRDKCFIEIVEISLATHIGLGNKSRGFLKKEVIWMTIPGFYRFRLFFGRRRFASTRPLGLLLFLRGRFRFLRLFLLAFFISRPINGTSSFFLFRGSSSF